MKGQVTAARAFASRTMRVYAANVARLLSNAGFDMADRLTFVAALMDEVVSRRSVDRPGGAVLSIPPDELLTALQLQDHVASALTPPGIAVRYLVAATPDAPIGRLEAAVGEQIRASDLFGRIGPTSYLLSVVVKNHEDIVAVGDRLGRALTGYGLDVRLDRLKGLDAIEKLLGADPAYRPVRAIRPGSRINVALTGGAARAVAHAGVLEVLQRHEVEITGVAATSAGAVVGAMFALGQSPRHIGERFAEFAGSPVYREIRRSFALYRRRSHLSHGTTRALSLTSLAFTSDHELSAISDEVYDDFITYFVGADRAIESLPLPLAICATNLTSGSAWIGSQGSLHQALRASCAVPGLFPPQRIGTALLVDGSPICETPIAALPFLPPTSDSLLIYLERPERVPAEARTSLELAMQINAVTHAHLVREQVLRASHVLTIDVSDVGWLEFRRSASVVALGRAAAARAIEV